MFPESIIQLTDSLKSLYINTSKKLKGSDRRQFMADSFRLRGRKRIEENLPNLLSDIVSIVDPQSQTDPTFNSIKLYTSLSAAEVRHQLIELKRYV